MSEPRDSSEESDTHFKTTLIISLTIYNNSSQKSKKSKAAEKSLKVKEIDFIVTEDNYLEILTEILKSHSQEKYKVTARRHYTFKYIYPPSKVYVIYQIGIMCWLTSNYYSVRDAVDVDSEKDYKQMAKSILQARPKKVKILVDMKDVQRSCRAVSHK